jgi:hypothetical protein
MILGYSLASFAQPQEASYILEPVKGLYFDTTDRKEIVLVFKRSTKSGNEEKLIISGRLTYALEDNMEKTEVLGRNNHHSITIYGDDFPTKNPELYNLIKDSLSVKDKKKLTLLVFYLRGITDNYINRMTFTYGLWEPSNEDVRIETKYHFNLVR